MEILQIVWIFYVIFIVFTCVLVNYIVIKKGLNDRYKPTILVTAIVLLSVFWPGTLLALLYTKGQKDHKEGDKNGDY